MKNFIAEGERLEVIAPVGGLTPGQLYAKGSKVVAVINGGVEGDLCACMTKGVFEVGKGSGQIDQGDKLYLITASGLVTKTATSNIYVGYAHETALTGDTTVKVVLVDNPGDVQSVPKATVIAALGTTSNLTALVPTAATFAGAACGGGATPANTDVNTAIDTFAGLVITALGLKADNADVETLRTETEARLDAIEAKVDALIAALKAATLMATS